MVLKPAQEKKRGEREVSVSFRVNKATKKRLKALADYSGLSQSYVLEKLIDTEFERMSRKKKG